MNFLAAITTVLSAQRRPNTNYGEANAACICISFAGHCGVYRLSTRQKSSCCHHHTDVEYRPFVFGISHDYVFSTCLISGRLCHRQLFSEHRHVRSQRATQHTIQRRMTRVVSVFAHENHTRCYALHSKRCT